MLRVLIEARLRRGSSGGVETVLLGLADGIAQLGGDDRYTFLVQGEDNDWLAERLGPNSELLPVRSEAVAPRRSTLRRTVGALAPEGLMPHVRAARWRARDRYDRSGRMSLLSPPDVNISGFDVVHFPYQSGFRTTTPTVFQPHDLQHLHLPEFFSADERARRTAVYRALCDQSRIVVVGSRWVADDVVHHLRVEPSKVIVVNLAPLTLESTSPGDLKPFHLPEEFAYYPAATWPHKNHASLLRAISMLRDSGLRVPLVCTGHLTAHYSKLGQLVSELRLQDQIRFLGFVDQSIVSALYRAARLVVIPTMFEAGSFPIWESFSAGTPVVCSTVTSLPEQAGDAALLFDPRDVAGIADAISATWTDSSLRLKLAASGRQRLAGLSWVETARRLRAVYRIAADRASDEDRELLAQPTIM